MLRCRRFGAANYCRRRIRRVQGFGYAIGADNYNPLPNASILLKFPITSTERPLGPVVHFNKRWHIWTANPGGNRLDAFLVKVPAEVLDPDIIAGGAAPFIERNKQ